MYIKWYEKNTYKKSEKITRKKLKKITHKKLEKNYTKKAKKNTKMGQKPKTHTKRDKIHLPNWQKKHRFVYAGWCFGSYPY